MSRKNLDLMVVVFIALINIALGAGWFHPTAFLSIFGIALVLALPGYVLSQLLLPDLPLEERILVSLGLSVAIAGLCGLLLDFTPWGLNTASWGLSLGVLTLLGTGWLWLRRRTSAAGGDRLARFELPPRSALLYGLALVFVVAAFYFLKIGSAQSAAPLTSLWANYDPGSASVLDFGIQNEEGKPESYVLVVEQGGRKLQVLAGIDLANGKSYTGQLKIQAAAQQPVNVLLYLAGQPTQVYRQVFVTLPQKTARTQGKLKEHDLHDRRLLLSLLVVGLLIFITVYAYLSAPQFRAAAGEQTPGTPSATATALAVRPVSPERDATLEPSPTAAPSPTATSTPVPVNPPAIAGVQDMHVVLNETFTDPNLNASLWNTQFRWGNTNPPELEEYIPDALKIHSGILSITANKTEDGKLPYSSGMIASNDRFYFQYGYVEIQARAPAGRGLWPAFWLLAQAQSAEEIDVMEILGQDPTTVYTTLHYKLANQQKMEEDTHYRGPDFSRDFHTFGVDWEWDKIVWYIDGKEVFRVTDHVPQVPMYLIADLAVGGVWAGPPDASTVFPAAFDINYIRVFMH